MLIVNLIYSALVSRIKESTLVIYVYGFFILNSSDIIIKTKGKKYYGISLKKKPKGNSQDPTLINKAFDSILRGPGPDGAFNKIKNDIQEARTEYFAGVVKEAVRKDILTIPNIDKLKISRREII